MPPDGPAEVPLEAPTDAAPAPLTLVGIGTSAGGLAALEAFFRAVPEDARATLAFVVVQHLAPNHKSILSELIQRWTPFVVVEAVTDLTIERGHIYVTPPNRDLALSGDLLRPVGLSGQRRHLPIDSFLETLASSHGARAIAVILSGTGSDGTLGVRAIHAAGGLVFVQSPESADFAAMPQSAIATELADRVLPPQDLARALTTSRTSTAHAAASDGASPPTEPDALAPNPTGQVDQSDQVDKILEVIRLRTHHDFSRYKRNTIGRRIERRIATLRLPDLDAYRALIDSDPHEAEVLFGDLLIGVTSFFRDREAFDALRTAALDVLIKKPPGATVRVWVPGCSNGAEAYSIAILLTELIALRKLDLKLQLFATDVDPTAIAVARRGLFPPAIAHDLSAERLARYFAPLREGAELRVQNAIRELIVFSEHDVVRDPPFSKLDLISCRNLFIYLEPDLQKRVLSVFHYALNPAGLLLLGTSETVGDGSDLFVTLDRHWKVYQRKDDPRRTANAPLTLAAAPRSPVPLAAPSPLPTASALQSLTEKGLLDLYGAAGLLVDADGEVLFLHGRTGLFLELAPGEASINLFKMARPGLRTELAVAMRRAVDTDAPVVCLGVKVQAERELTEVDLTVRPTASPGGARLFLVVLAPARRVPPRDNLDAPPPDGSDAAELDLLRDKLRLHEEHARAQNEDLARFNEELRSNNEELQSTIEELQSTVEELETSKEELQSVNEELITVNSELTLKLTELSRVNNDMNNLLTATGIGTIFVDFDLHIQRFTPTVTPIINLIPGDVGRPVGHIVSNLLGYDTLVADVEAVLATLVPHEVEVQSRAGVWYSLRIRPYRTVDNVIEGAVITFIDVSELRPDRERKSESP